MKVKASAQREFTRNWSIGLIELLEQRASPWARELSLYQDHYNFVTLSLLTGPDDFTALNRTLTFDPSMTRQEVVVVITNDVIVEPDQDFRSRLQLTAVETGVRVDPPETTIVIVDDDSKLVK